MELIAGNCCCDAENATAGEDDVGETLSALSSTHAHTVSKSLTNTSMYDKVASRLSEELLAALAWSAHTPMPDTHRDNAAAPNVSSKATSRRSWEKFLAQLVANLSSQARAVHPTAAVSDVTSISLTGDPIPSTTSAPSVGSVWYSLCYRLISSSSSAVHQVRC